MVRGFERAPSPKLAGGAPRCRTLARRDQTRPKPNCGSRPAAPEVVDGGVELGADLGRGPGRVLGRDQRRHAGDVRGRHRGAGERDVAAAALGREDVDARGGDLDVGVGVGERGARVVGVGRGDGDDLRVGGRVVQGRVAVVAGRGDDQRAAAVV